MADVTAMVIEMADVDDQLKALNQRRKDLRSDILDYFDTEGLTTFEVEGCAKATVSRPQSLVFNVEKLEAIADAETYEMVTTRVIDKSKLEAAIKLGQIDDDVVDSISSYEEQSPRLSVRRLKND